MRIPISDLIDKMTILKLKIERVGEPHLKKEYEEYKKVVINYKIQGELWEIESHSNLIRACSFQFFH